MPPDSTVRPSNRLIHEKSPYLLQHAHNPVDWYPWGKEAFARARREDKPVFLSIGYSTCYWCHVMEGESFENAEVARLLNEEFVSIKVDREERPDLDAIYMSAVQAMSGQGGWPMTVFLTPEGKPFWGGTYFPAEDLHGRPGMKTILPAIREAWRTKREELLASSRSLTAMLQPRAPGPADAPLMLEAVRESVRQIAQEYDPAYGGFGPAPKFPRTAVLALLLRQWARTRDAQTLAMVEATLEAMARGGIHDQLGGGFHRYSTDEQWLVPHFEKMLYDQALIARAYLEAYQATGKRAYAVVARAVFDYVLRDLRDAGGAFYSAEDAGEVGAEGEFYVWTAEEIDRILGERAEPFKRAYGVTPQGNFSAEGGSAPSSKGGGGERGTNILAVQPGMEADREQMQAARAALLTARSRRPRPHRDDKILTDWNGLMIGALAYGGRVLDERRYTEAAQQAAAFVLERMELNGTLLHRYRDGEAKIAGFLDDYACLAWGLLDLYEATQEPRWLAEAKRLTEEMVRLFWDEAAGGFFFSGAHNEPLIANTKELYDGAAPSGNSVAALVLVRLGQLTMDQSLQTRVEQLFRAFSGQIARMPHAFPQALIALDAWLGPSQEIVIAGNPEQPATQQMRRAVSARFLPRAILVLHPTGNAGEAIEQLVPFVKNQQPLKGQPTAYVCQHHICNLPITDLEQFMTVLEESR